jgi:hypothetical protein
MYVKATRRAVRAILSVVHGEIPDLGVFHQGPVAQWHDQTHDTSAWPSAGDDAAPESGAAAAEPSGGRVFLPVHWNQMSSICVESTGSFCAPIA